MSKKSTHLVVTDFDTRCIAAGSSVQVLVFWGFIGHMQWQNKTPRENPAQGVVHLRGTIFAHFRYLVNSNLTRLKSIKLTLNSFLTKLFSKLAKPILSSPVINIYYAKT